MQATVNLYQAHAQQCTTIISRQSHLHTGTLHYRERTGVDMHVGHRSTDISTPAAPAITLPTHPACKQLSIYIKHMHSNAQLSFLDTRTCIQALCTTRNVPGWTCTSAFAAPTSALLLRLSPHCRRILQSSNCPYMANTCTAMHNYHF